MALVENNLMGSLNTYRIKKFELCTLPAFRCGVCTFQCVSVCAKEYFSLRRRTGSFCGKVGNKQPVFSIAGQEFISHIRETIYVAI